MNFILNILILLISIAFISVAVVNLLLNIIRFKKANEVIKANPKFADGKVTDIIHDKGKVYVKVEFQSANNGSVFANFFQFNEKKFNDRYQKDQAVRIMYPDTAELEKVTAFPIYLEGEKIAVDAAGIVLDSFLILAGVYLFGMTLFSLLAKDPTTGMIGLQWKGRPFIPSTAQLDGDNGSTACFNGGYLLLFVVFYFFLGTYLIDRLVGLPDEQKQEYLKICGIKGKAEVKTFKLVGKKNAKGFKQSQMKIEFFTNKGEKVEADINSYLYTETQEQYVTILYDPKHPKNVVYLKEGSKKEEKEAKEIE